MDIQFSQNYLLKRQFFPHWLVLTASLFLFRNLNLRNSQLNWSWSKSDVESIGIIVQTILWLHFEPTSNMVISLDFLEKWCETNKILFLWLCREQYKLNRHSEFSIWLFIQVSKKADLDYATEGMFFCLFFGFFFDISIGDAWFSTVWP